MGAYNSKNFFRCVSTGIKYLNTMPAWKAAYLGKRKHSKYRVAPTTSSFFNLLKGVQHRYPQLTYKQVVAVGTQVWNQMTWSEKKPYYMLAWKEQLKKEVRHKRYSQQLDYNKKLRIPGSNGRFQGVTTNKLIAIRAKHRFLAVSTRKLSVFHENGRRNIKDLKKVVSFCKNGKYCIQLARCKVQVGTTNRYDLRSNARRITNTPAQEMYVNSEDPIRRNLQPQEFPTMAENHTFNAIKMDVVSVVNDMNQRASETALNMRKYRSSTAHNLII